MLPKESPLTDLLLTEKDELPAEKIVDKTLKQKLLKKKSSQLMHCYMFLSE